MYQIQMLYKLNSTQKLIYNYRIHQQEIWLLRKNKIH